MKTIRGASHVLACFAMVIAQGALTMAVAADDPDRGQFSAADFKFAKEAARDGMFEISMGNLAAANSKTTTVQQFGLRMVRDHGKIGEDLSQLAARKGAILSIALSTHQQKEVDKLAALAGPAFDKAYLALMIKGHKADEKEFKKASAELQDPDLKTFAANALPIIQDHLKAAQDLDFSLKHELSMNRPE